MLNLHTHSVYSYKKSIANINDIALKSKKQGEKSFCITDYNCLKSFVKAFNIAAKNDMKFIPGCEFFVKPSDNYNVYYIKDRISFLQKEMRLKRTTKEMAVEFQKEIDSLEEKIDKNLCTDYHTVILLAKNNEGLKSLFEIYNHSKELNDDGDLYVENETIFNNKKGLICLTGGIRSEIIFYIRIGELEKAKEILNSYKDNFGFNKDTNTSNFYSTLEFQNMNRNPKGILNEVDSMNILIDISRENNVPIVCSNDVKYVNIEDRANYRLFVNILSSSENVKFYKDGCYMCTEDEIVSKMSYNFPIDAINEGLDNIKIIDSLIEDIPTPKAHELKDCADELTKLCIKGWEKLRKGTEYEKESWERFHYELEIINSRNFGQYFIKVLNIVETAFDLGILVGPSRGSGGGSEVCYLTGITHLDPLRYGLFFERFLNPGRNGFPDIDIDMASSPVAFVNSNELISTPIGDFSRDDIIETKTHGNITAGNLYLLIQKGEEIEI